MLLCLILLDYLSGKKHVYKPIGTLRKTEPKSTVSTWDWISFSSFTICSKCGSSFRLIFCLGFCRSQEISGLTRARPIPLAIDWAEYHTSAGNQSMNKWTHFLLESPSG